MLAENAAGKGEAGVREFENVPQLSERAREHFEVARQFEADFTSREFKDAYVKAFPGRAVGSIIPTDFAFNSDQYDKERRPSFLEVLEEGRLRYVGLEEGQRKKAKQNPLWTRDELILATEFYKRFAPSIPGKADERLIALSQEIRSVAESLGLQGDETFRNPNGVYMKLMELRKYDPSYSGKGLGRKSRPIEQEIWNLSEHHLQTAVSQIRATLSEIQNGNATVAGGRAIDEPEIAEASEGALVTRLHRFRERDRKIVRDKKRAFLKENGSLFCEVCHFDFEEAYGPRGRDFIECHHTVPVSEMEPGAKTKLSDLALVCANCHRMIHAKRPWLEPDELKDLMKPTA